MKCFSHVDADAVAHCPSCGKGLCPTCATRFDPPLCEACLLAHNRTCARQLSLGLAVSAGLFAVTLFFSVSLVAEQHGPLAHYGVALLMSLVVAFAYWGWRFVAARYSDTVNTGLAHVLLKLILSIFLGVFVGPYQITQSLRQLRNERALRAQIARGEV